MGNVAELRKGLRLLHVLVELVDELVAPHGQVVLCAVALGLEAFGTLLYLWLDLVRPRPRLADESQLVLGEGEGLLGQEAERLARVVELGVEAGEEAGRLLRGGGENSTS
eukprot:4024644-Pleurochrysis_carterae.AAC.2